MSPVGQNLEGNQMHKGISHQCQVSEMKNSTCGQAKPSLVTFCIQRRNLRTQYLVPSILYFFCTTLIYTALCEEDTWNFVWTKPSQLLWWGDLLQRAGSAKWIPYDWHHSGITTPIIITDQGKWDNQSACWDNADLLWERLVLISDTSCILYTLIFYILKNITSKVMCASCLFKFVM